LVPCLALLLVNSLGNEPGAEDKGTPVPKGAKVSLVVDKKTYFLGENVLVHFCVENVGTEPFPITLGGDYRFASRALSFSVEAIDAKGKDCADPDPSGFCMGGLIHSPTIKPGQKHYESVPLMRYRRIEEPGTYTIRVSHGLGWKETDDRKIPVAEATITFVRPTEEQARKVIEEAYALDKDSGGTSGGRRKPFADFSVLRDPVYLPILMERAKDGCEKALEGIGSIATPQATEALIRLADHENAAFALQAVRTLNYRLPDPLLAGELPVRNVFHNEQVDARSWYVSRSWRPRFGDDVRALARKLLAKDDQDSVKCGGFMLQAVGRKEDLPALTRALDRAVAEAARAPIEKGLYPRPRGACQELMRAARMLAARGIPAPVDLKTPGEALVFASLVGAGEKSRPAGWETRYAGLLCHETPYVREIALENLPVPVPKALEKLLPPLLTDPDVDVQIAACHLAKKTKLPSLKGPVLKALASAKEEWQFRAVTSAAWEYDAKWETIQILVSRLDEAEMTAQCLDSLRYWAFEDLPIHSIPTAKHLDAAAGKTCKARWTKFLDEHGEELKKGKRFKFGDPAFTPDLFPEFRFKDKDKTDPFFRPVPGS
jgi:hypothetical protein